jgi:hypothetical protein
LLTLTRKIKIHILIQGIAFKVVGIKGKKKRKQLAKGFFLTHQEICKEILANTIAETA